MIKAYVEYKKWWIDWQSERTTIEEDFHVTREQAFEEHINNKTLYELMENLCDWEEN